MTKQSESPDVVPGVRILPAPRFDLRLVDEPWAFAVRNGEAIAAHWAQESALNPHIYNGKVLIAARSGFGDDGSFFGDHCVVDFAAFLAWRDWGFSADDGRNIFGSALLRPRDGGFIMGVMGAHTSNPGKVYPPSGTLDLGDVAPDGTIDIEASMVRELKEETGLEASRFRLGPAFIIIEDNARICAARILEADEDAETLLGEIAANIAADPEPELSGAIHVRAGMDLPEDVYLPYVRAIITALG
jgi:8-oxo-dGTP pyrophosphatase MutT (NUDIX family)